MNAVKKIFLIDSLLIDLKGHCFLEATALCEGAKKSGMDAQIMGNPGMDKTIARTNNILPLAPDYKLDVPLLLKVFQKSLKFFDIGVCTAKQEEESLSGILHEKTLSPRQKLKLLLKKTPLRLLPASYWLEKPMAAFFRNLPQEPESIYLFQTASFPIIRRVLRGLYKSGSDLRVVFSSHYAMTQAEIDEIVALLGDLDLTVPPLFFWSSEIHVKRHYDMGLHSAKLLPIPQPGWERYLNVSGGRNEYLTITFVGLSTYLKGFHLLPELVKRVREHFPERKFQFDIQYSPLPKRDIHYRAVRAAYSRLQKLDVNLITEALDNEAYYDLLYRSDIILQPYQVDGSHKHYSTGTSSGILIEALARGKIPIVPANTWLATQVEKFKSGKVFSGNPDFYAKVIEAVNEFDTLKTAAEANKEYWSKLHCPENFIKTILAEYK